ncbi:MAG: DUF2264 domain-containing protein [Rikenellaceae bacterium]
MKRLILSCCIFMSTALFATQIDKATLRIVDESLDFAVVQSMKMYETVEPMQGRLPRTSKDGKLVTSTPSAWTSGFYPGLMWYLYEYTNREDILQAAQEMTSRLEKQQYFTQDHDVGFVINCSYGNGYRLTKNPEYRPIMVNAAKSLATRFDPVVGCTRSWNRRDWGYVVIIDNMMNLELLTSASGLAGDDTYYNMAISHADKTLDNHFREDGSSYHLVGYDSISGKANIKATYQGYSDSSSWARGQGWALYGFTMMYRQTGEQRYLDRAVKVAKFLINHPRMPKDKIPYWDFDLPTFKDAPRDASAGALMASAFIELSQMVEGELSQSCLRIAEEQLRSLSSSKYRAKLGANNGFILMHSTGFFAKNSEVDKPLSYADYYYVEAMMRYRRLAQGRNVVDVATMYSTQEERAVWLDAMNQICRPVLEAMSRDELKQDMLLESRDKMSSRREVAYLEALGRTLMGIAPWLELEVDSTPEGALRGEYIDMAIKSITNGVDPSSSDYLNFSKGRQPLVDAAFLAHAILRAPTQLWDNLDEVTQQRLLLELASTRSIQPGQNNWLLFSAMVECTLMEHGAEYDSRRLTSVIEAFTAWYKGDGWYGDGDTFHLDYYNSYVIHPMLMQVLDVMNKHKINDSGLREIEAARYGRYAQQQEMLISPEGTYPMIGRSMAYRFGAFHALSDAAYRGLLPKEMTPAQVRSALTAVIQRQISMPDTFNEDGWLRIGFCGSQPYVGESYISTGSLYLSSAVFIALGLDAQSEFWSGEPTPWSQKRAWSGDSDVRVDKAIKY